MVCPNLTRLGLKPVFLAPVSSALTEANSLHVRSAITMSLPLLCSLSVSSLGESSCHHSQVLPWRLLSDKQSGVCPQGGLPPSESGYSRSLWPGDQPPGVLLRLNSEPLGFGCLRHVAKAIIIMAGAGKQSLLENMKEG